MSANGHGSCAFAVVKNRCQSEILTMEQDIKPSPLQLYVHIPFCVHKCHYCDFNSHERAQPDWDAYTGALTTELRRRSALAPFAGRALQTIFFGGGTPSLAPPSLIAAVVDAARNCCGLLDGAEITIEANPGASDAANFRACREAGVNRLSIGVQSLNAAELRWLERIHSAEEAARAMRMAREAGFDNINLDLMYGLPKQRIEAWLESLHAAIALEPEHLSCYQLTVEPHTKLAATHARKPYPLPDDELALMMFRSTREQLQLAGYAAYEISNFARPGRACRHNDGYWLYHDYIGIGAGAAGKWDRSDGGVTRYSNIRTPERYINAARNNDATGNSETLDRAQAAAEACWLGLRRADGVNRAAFRQRFEFDPWLQFRPQLQPWAASGKLIIRPDALLLSANGLHLTDAIAASVL